AGGDSHPLTAHGYHRLAGNLYAQGRYADAEDAGRAAARCYEMARLAVNATGMGRAAFGADHSPLPLLAACLARQDKPADAWPCLEQYLGRGLLEDLAGRQPPRLRPAEAR